MKDVDRLWLLNLADRIEAQSEGMITYSKEFAAKVRKIAEEEKQGES